MEFKRTCEWCGATFIAHSYKTQFCSKQCNDFAYKAAKKKEREQEYLFLLKDNTYCDLEHAFRTKNLCWP
ncbi:hypothetical protein HMPREF3034_01778 [Prevotella sp. DNF00663]|nr:hypothetical protein HMPREF3034_01778 [Prevotella sp. DNF00663]